MLSSEAPVMAGACWADGVGAKWGMGLRVGLGFGLPAAPPSRALACSLSVGSDDGDMLVGLSGLADWFAR